MAQIVPDNTLPLGERSQVFGNPIIQIDGGATRGNNLFHSFEYFSLPTGSTAWFNNAPTIQNIFTRVTGGSISNIDGVIKANGTANLFLLNPNGILFGSNARLNIGGSFVASTADSINFADGTLFSAKAPQTTPLLTISVPVGLQLGQNPGNITVQGSGYNLSTQKPFFSPTIRGSSTTGLQVPSGKTLALIGGDINIEGGTLTAEQGRVELGSIREGQVSLSSTATGLAFSYQGVQSFEDIQLSQQALADASSGGSIQVRGDRVSLVDGSIMLIQNQSEQRPGRIDVNATSSVELNGTSPDGISFVGGLRSETTGSGSGADIAISTKQLLIQDGAGLLTISYDTGRSGNVAVFASDRVRLSGFSPLAPVVQTLINSVGLNSGDAGDVTVSTRQLTIQSGAYIGTQINSTDNTSRGGDVTINATELVEVIGANDLTVSNVSAATNFAGNAGNVTINTSKLVVRGGGAVTTYTLGSGDAGKITINATESVEVSGKVLILAPVSSTVSSFAFVYPFPGVPVPSPSGNSGDVTLNTPTLSVTDGGKLDVSHEGTGNAGTLLVNANLLVLDRGGTITAATASGEGGNIDLQVGDLLLMRHNSQITTSASGTGSGGNININTPLLVAVPIENSDIRADSVNARGGNVTITTDGLFGIQFREEGTPLSDITATGANSALNGTVQVNIQRINPSQGLVELPTTLVDRSRLIAQGCSANRGNSFVVTGRGGLPATPQQALSNDPLWRDWRTPAVANRQSNTSPRAVMPSGSPTSTQPTASATLVEATGWEINPNRQVVLTATAPQENPYQPETQPIDCNRS
jgi:filamentous hemagglutinin family protein